RDQAVRAESVSSSGRAAEEAVQISTAPEQHSSEGGNGQQLAGVGGSADDTGGRSHGLVQVVCGAPNAREGLMVAWLPPGATVPDTYGKDPFVLEARELRGVMSNGMLASARELALGTDHNGIVEIDDETARPGDDFAVAYQLNDAIINIENK